MWTMKTPDVGSTSTRVQLFGVSLCELVDGPMRADMQPFGAEQLGAICHVDRN
jgi:hypothetical protein